MTIPLLVFIFATVVHLGRGGYNPTVPLLTLLFLTWVGATLLNRGSAWGARNRDRALRFLPLCFSVIAAFIPVLRSLSPEAQQAFAFMRWGTVGLVALLAFVPPKYSVMRFSGYGLLSLFIGLSVPYLSPEPWIDVFRSNSLGVDHLWEGRNPYSQTYPDLYQGAYDYVPGFLYWPGTLLIQALSKACTGDIRTFQILMWWSVPLGMARRFRGEESRSIGILWWSLPFLPFGFEQAWIDPMLSFTFALVLSAPVQGVWAGLGAAIKQYGGMFGFFQLIHLLVLGKIREAVRFALSAGFLFGLLVVPFLMWDGRALIEMTVSRHVVAAVRPDALNFTAFLFRSFGSAPPAFLQGIAIAIGLVLAVLHQLRNGKIRGLRTVPESCAILFGFSIFFGKFAFCNYHWLLISFWLLSEWVGLSEQSADAA